jgi:pilus assembly protein CpaF
MSEAVRIITEQVRTRVRRDGVDLASTSGLAEQYVRDEVQRYAERALGNSLPLIADERQAAREVVASLTGFGALQPFLDDPGIEEIWINAPSRVFVARDGVPELTTMVLTEREVRDLVERMLQASGRRVDLSSPFVDASLPDGSRLHVVIPDITRQHWAVNIRKFTRRIRDLNQLVGLGALTQQSAEFLRMCVLAGQNILVSGASQTGKTTMLNALLSATRKNERIITVEDAAELILQQEHTVRLETRPSNIEGKGAITQRDLVRNALRMRPDRLIVGEVREAESLDLLIALNSGLPGMCSIHANSARDALGKLSTLPLLAGRNIDSSFVLPTVAGCIDIVVHCEIDRHGRRRVTEILAPSGQLSGALIEASPIFLARGGVLEPTGGYPTKLAKFHAAGLDPAIVLRAGAA